MAKTPLLGTGLSGLVGTTVTHLLADKYQFENLDITSGVDILDPAQIDTIFQTSPAKSVVHLAAFTDVNGANQQKGDKTGLCYRLNVEGTRNIAKACTKHDKHLIHFSTDFVFDGTKSTAYTENDQPNPIEWYGQTKFWAEEELTKHCRNSLIMRIAYPYGGSHPQRRDLVQKIAEKLENDSLPPQFSDNLITPTSITDIATAIDLFATKHTTGLYHVTGSTPLSSYDLAVIIAKSLGKDPKHIKKSSVKEYNQTAPRPFQVKLDISNHKFTTDLGHTPLGVDTGLSQVFS